MLELADGGRGHDDDGRQERPPHRAGRVVRQGVQRRRHADDAAAGGQHVGDDEQQAGDLLADYAADDLGHVRNRMAVRMTGAEVAQDHKGVGVEGAPGDDADGASHGAQRQQRGRQRQHPRCEQDLGEDDGRIEPVHIAEVDPRVGLFEHLVLLVGVTVRAALLGVVAGVRMGLGQLSVPDRHGGRGQERAKEGKTKDN